MCCVLKNGLQVKDNFYLIGLELYNKRSAKCIGLEGDYVE